MDSHGHNGWIIVWHLNFSDGSFEAIWEWSSKTGGSFISNRENLIFGSINVWSKENFLNFSYNSGVNGTAKTFIGSNWNKNDAWILTFIWHFLLHKLITLENHINCVKTEISTIM